MEFRVLGSLEVRRGDDLVDIGSSNERKVLAALLVDPNAVVSTSRLIEVVSATRRRTPPHLRHTKRQAISASMA
jgi:hypothetical protein